MVERPGIWKIGLNFGLISGVAMAIYSLLLILTNTQTNTLLGFLSYGILFVGIIWSHRDFKQKGDSFMTYGEGLGIGSAVSVVAGVVTGTFSVIYNKLIDPEMMQRLFQEQIIKMQDMGSSQDQIELSRKIFSVMQHPVVMFLMAIIGLLFFGFLISLIVTAFTKKTNPEVYN